MNYNIGDRVTFMIESRQYTGIIMDIVEEGQLFNVDCGSIIVFNVSKVSIR